MVIELVSGSLHIQQNAKFILKNSSFFRSTKTIKNCNGRWYYEATHYAGGTNYHLIGFSINQSYITFYPLGNPSLPNFYMHQSLSQTSNEFSRIPFSVEDEHTVGVGIDVDEHRFYVFYNNHFSYYDFVMTNKCQNLNTRIFGAYTSITNDEVSINFGDEPFKYNISGFTPWSKSPKRFSCQYKKIAKNPFCFQNSQILNTF